MPVVEEICTITTRGQTTVPKAVRQALGVGQGGRIAFRVEEDRVVVRAVREDATGDPALAPFLALLAHDMSDRPASAVRPLPATLIARMDALTRACGAVDPDEAIEGEVGL